MDARPPPAPPTAPAAGTLDDLDLVWADDSAPGIRRRRRGRGFEYLGPDGRRVADAAALARIRALAVPPAWESVWICADPAGHVQATGRDARGRKQYRYHPRFRAHRDATKFARLLEFGEALPRVRARVAADLAAPGITREVVVAAVVRLLETTMVRVGNEEYARANRSYGLTTLRSRHARFERAGLRLVFRGKSGNDHEVRVTDRRLRGVVRRCQDLPGQTLFRYRDGDGQPRPVTSTEVNDYLRAAAGIPVTAKDFRTWMGTLLAAVAFAGIPPPRSERQGRRTVQAVADIVAGHLGNTAAVARASYIHPYVVERYLDGTLHDLWDAGPARPAKGLLTEERRLLALLRRARRDERRAARTRPGTRRPRAARR